MADEATLLKRIREYDTAALAQVYDKYYERIYRYVYCYLGQVDAAEDLTANVFFRLLRSVRDGRSPNKNLAAWLYRVAHNLVVDTFRRGPAEELELVEWQESQEPDVMHIVEQRLQMERVRLALRELTPSQQQVIVLRFLEGMDSREVAAVMGKSEGAVDALQHRALLALRKALTQGQGPGPKGEQAGGKRKAASPLGLRPRGASHPAGLDDILFNNPEGSNIEDQTTKKGSHTSMFGALILKSILILFRPARFVAAASAAYAKPEVLVTNGQTCVHSPLAREVTQWRVT